MVISYIIGGLGNQMFQYAAGRALSLERNESLHLDISGFNGYTLHQGFELSRVFVCPAVIASKTEIRDILGWQHLPGIKRILARPSIEVFRRNGFVVEPHFHYWQEISQIPHNCYLAGYWQSEKYFQAYASKIRADFTFKLPMTDINTKLAEQITQVNAVSLHVRRADYVSSAKNNSMYGVCSLDYYQAAIAYISERVINPQFFIFSDDMAWVKDHLNVGMTCQYIEHNQGSESYIDMRLMSLCRHHIIANSSFSWWGAWLSANPEKIVVRPKKWFVNDNNIVDLIPFDWKSV